MNYRDWLAEKFPGGKVQKLSVNANLSCPNRDGTIGTGGCIYCDNTTFTPSYCMAGGGVARQLADGRQFFARKYPSMRYLAYFQSFTGTHSSSIPLLRALYEEAATQPGVVGLIIGTRPDTLPPQVVDLLADINRRLPVIVEIGAETSSDATLRLINRHHTWHDVCDAVERLVAVGIDCGLHLIAGLPGEDADRTLRSVDDACSLPISTIKLHQLQVIKDTPLHRMWERGEIDVKPYSLEDYIDLCVKVVERVPGHIAIERFLASSPPDKVVAPKWGLKNYQFAHLLENYLSSHKKF